jgi:predicted AlkP superfamily phosphohydrolase/phosphomutase
LAAGLVVVVLDAASATLIERWADRGALPTFARLRQDGCSLALRSRLELLPGGVHAELSTGRSCGKLGLFFHLDQLRTGEACARPLGDTEVAAGHFYWSAASRAERRVCVVDPALAAVARGSGCTQVVNWFTHDPLTPAASEPAGLLGELRQRYGDALYDSCDRAHGGTLEGYRAFASRLRESVRRKTRVLLDLLARDRWDLFCAGFSETHCAGHQFWHFFDHRHPLHPEDTPAELSDAIASVYREADAALGKLLDAAGGGARLLVLAVSGMRAAVGGPQLLQEVLHRLGLGPPRPLRFRLAPAVPEWLRRVVRKAHGGVVPEPYRLGYDPRIASAPSPEWRAFTLRNGHCGAIRLNLVGREPTGSVPPGPPAFKLIAEIRRRLSALRHVPSGEPLVERVATPAEIFGSPYHSDLPDLLIAFRRDLGALDACESPDVGLVSEPLRFRFNPRTGGHGDEARLWALGAGLPDGGVRLPDGDVLDVAPTVLRLLGVSAPHGLDGRPITGLVG